MADIARLVAALELQSSQFQKELQKANKSLERFESRATKTIGGVKKLFAGFAVGAAIVQGLRSLTGSIGELVAEAGHLKNFSSEVGVSVESLSTLGKAAQQFGVESGTLEQALLKLNKSIAEVSGGNKGLTETFAMLGVSLRDTNGNLKSTEPVLSDIADAFSKLPDGPLKTAAALEIFGKSGAQLIPFLNEGADGIAELQEQVRRLGGEISGATAEAADQFGNKLANLKTAFGGLGREVGDFVLPKLGAFFDLLSSGASKFRDFIDTTPQERIQDLTRNIEVLQQKLSVTPKFLSGFFVGQLKEAREELAQLRSEGGLIKDLLPGLSNELNVAGVAAQEKLAAGLKAADTAGKSAADSAKRAAEEQRRAIESAAQSLEDLNSGLIEQVQTFGLANSAVLEYRLTVGDLSESVGLLGERGNVLSESIVEQAKALEELNTAAEEQKKLQEQQRKDSEDIIALQNELLPLTSGLDSATLEYSESIEKLNEAYDKSAISSAQFELGLQNANLKLEEAQKRVKESSASSVVFAEEAAKGIQDAFADFFFDPFDKGLKGLLDNVQRTLDRIAAELIASKLADFLFGGKTSGSGSGTTGLLQNIGNLFASFGGSFGGAAGSGNASFTGQGLLTPRAHGGPVFAGGSYVVGEDGPELFSPSSNGRITPNNELGGNITTNIYVSAPSGRLAQESLEQVQTRVGLAVRRATRRNA